MSRNKKEISNKAIKDHQKLPWTRPSPTWPQEHKTKNQEEEISSKEEHCNDSTVTHTCCSFLDLSEERHVCYRSVFMNSCAMSVRYTVFSN